MATVTLAESAKLSQDMLASGVIENIITVNRFYEVLPFQGIEGNALSYNRENVLGNVQTAGVGDTITAKAAATFTKVTSELTTIIGDAEVNGLIQATRSDYTDQKATQIASKAKSAGRKYQDMLINGDGTGNDFDGILALVAAGQTITQDTGGTETDGGQLSFEKLDELIDLVTSKDGEVDFLQMNARTLRSYNALLRALGGASIGDVVELPSGIAVPAYRNIPIFRNDYIPVDQTQGAVDTTTSVIAGTLDDGSMEHGIGGITASREAGVQIKDIGDSETKDESITRVKWYCGLANYSEKGLAVLKGVTN